MRYAKVKFARLCQEFRLAASARVKQILSFRVFTVSDATNELFGFIGLVGLYTVTSLLCEDVWGWLRMSIATVIFGLLWIRNKVLINQRLRVKIACETLLLVGSFYILKNPILKHVIEDYPQENAHYVPNAVQVKKKPGKRPFISPPGISTNNFPGGILLTPRNFHVYLNGTNLSSQDGNYVNPIRMDLKKKPEVLITVRSETGRTIDYFQLQFLIKDCRLSATDSLWNQDASPEDVGSMTLTAPPTQRFVNSDKALNLPALKLSCKDNSDLLGTIWISGDNVKQSSFNFLINNRVEN